MTNGEENETKAQKRQRQTKEQFEALGTFVQAFEFLVDEIRSSCARLLAGNDRYYGDLARLILHHRVMTADPLVDIFRAMTTKGLNEKNKVEWDRKQKLEILAELCGHCKKIIEIRNKVLHGTWYIGWATNAQTDFSEIFASKFKVTSIGLQGDRLPKNVSEFRWAYGRVPQT